MRIHPRRSARKRHAAGRDRDDGTGLSEQEVTRLRETIRATPGLVGLHDLRTRPMADRVLCDAHIQVDPPLTVSEGHRISDTVHLRVRSTRPDVRDVLVHVDAENDDVFQTVPAGALPDRTEIVQTVERLFDTPPASAQVLIHYLGDRVEAEIVLGSDTLDECERENLRKRIEMLLAARPAYRTVTVLARIAP